MNPPGSAPRRPAGATASASLAPACPFLPGHTATLAIDGKAITTLHSSPLGNVTYMISPSPLHLPGGSHALSLDSLLITETASFSS